MGHERIENENTTQVSKCQTPEERMEWLATTRPWSEFQPYAREAIVEAFAEDPVLLEGFVLFAHQYGLIPQLASFGVQGGLYYDQLFRAEAAQVMLCIGNDAMRIIAAEVKAVDAGEAIDFVRNADVFVGNAGVASVAFRMAVALDENQLGAYMGMAALKQISLQVIEAEEWRRRGLAKIEWFEAQFNIHKRQ